MNYWVVKKVLAVLATYIPNDVFWNKFSLYYDIVICSFKAGLSLDLFIVVILFKNDWSTFFKTSDSVEKWQIHKIFFSKIRIGQKAAKNTCDVNDKFGPGTKIVRKAQLWFNKFCSCSEKADDDERSGRPSIVDKDHLGGSLRTDRRKPFR